MMQTDSVFVETTAPTSSMPATATSTNSDSGGIAEGRIANIAGGETLPRFCRNVFAFDLWLCLNCWGLFAFFGLLGVTGLALTGNLGDYVAERFPDEGSSVLYLIWLAVGSAVVVAIGGIVGNDLLLHGQRRGIWWVSAAVLCSLLQIGASVLMHGGLAEEVSIRTTAECCFVAVRMIFVVQVIVALMQFWDWDNSRRQWTNSIDGEFHSAEVRDDSSREEPRKVVTEFEILRLRWLPWGILAATGKAIGCTAGFAAAYGITQRQLMALPILTCLFWMSGIMIAWFAIVSLSALRCLWLPWRSDLDPNELGVLQQGYQTPCDSEEYVMSLRAAGYSFPVRVVQLFVWKIRHRTAPVASLFRTTARYAWLCVIASGVVAGGSSFAYMKYLENQLYSANRHFREGEAHFLRDDYAAALKSLDKAIELDPTDPVFHACRGWTLERQERLDEAMDAYDRAIEIRPQFTEVWMRRGGVYHAQGKLPKSLADLNRSIQLDEDFAAAFVERGNAYRSQGQSQKAIADYDAALALRPNWTLAKEERAEALQEVQASESVSTSD